MDPLTHHTSLLASLTQKAVSFWNDHQKVIYYALLAGCPHVVDLLLYILLVGEVVGLVLVLPPLAFYLHA